jgi:hypothetical protein
MSSSLNIQLAYAKSSKWNKLLSKGNLTVQWISYKTGLETAIKVNIAKTFLETDWPGLKSLSVVRLSFLKEKLLLRETGT